MSSANSESKKNLRTQEAEMYKMISESLELFPLTPVLIPFLVVKAPIAKEDREPDVWCAFTAGTGLRSQE